MIYRTSQRGTYRNINNNLDLLSYRIAQLSNKIASEKSINKPSDNPSGAAAVLRNRTLLSEISQYTDNINYSNNWLTNTGNVMDSIKGALDEIYAKAEQGATDTYSADQRRIIATEIDALFQSIVQFADSKFGDNYLFSGQEVGTQPFSTSLRARNIAAACDNSSLWTGQVQTASSLYSPRPDLPVQSERYLVEVVQPGGIDSAAYANQNYLSSLKIFGSNQYGDYALNITSKSPEYNLTQIRLVAGPADTWSTGSTAQNDLITFYNQSRNDPLNVVYTYAAGSASATTADYSASTNTLTVRLQPSEDPPFGSATSSMASASDVVAAINAWSGQTGVTAGTASTGIIDLAKDSFGQPKNEVFTLNNQVQVKVTGQQITVYLPAGQNGSGLSLTPSVSAVVRAINSDPAASKMIEAQAENLSKLFPYWPDATSGSIRTETGFQPLIASDPYTLAWTETDLKGDHNDLIFSIKNEPGAPRGSAGNNVTVVYKYSETPDLTSDTAAFYDASSQTVTVILGNNGPVYLEEYKRLYSDPKSGAFLNAHEADRLARLSARTTTAQDVISAVTGLDAYPNRTYLDARLAEGNSGLGRVLPGGPFQLSQGYSQAALFRVSQDGGKTWGPPQSFSPSQYPGDQLFYNSQLGHASLTTSLPGGANDLVFTANYMGTWGDDLRIEYREPNAPGSPLSVTVGPNPWNICVNLATDSTGRIITTAQDILSAVSNHPQASQLVTVGLANYHEGGLGIVRGMDCQALATGEPYEITGQTRITPLGYATGTVAFPYTPPDQSSPDLIYQALVHGEAGNAVGIRYTTSADPAIYGSAAQYQDHVSISYDYLPNGDQVAVVHLATESLPSCPDPDTERLAYDAWIKLFPVYSCTSSRAVLSTAGDVLEALIAKNLENPASALVWASMDYKDEGWDSTAKVGPTKSTVWLSGGDSSLKEENHGISLKFIPDGTALQVGDLFEVEVGWYHGDQNNLDVNAMNSYRTTMNVVGSDLLGANGADDNILDTIGRLSWALNNNNTELVERELPHLKAALEKITTMETNVGTRIIRNQFVLNNLEQDKYTAESTLSAVEDADFTRLITDLKNAQLVYEAVLGSTGLTTKLSLLNYI